MHAPLQLQLAACLSSHNLADKLYPFHLPKDISCCAGDFLELKSNPDVPLAADNEIFEVSIAGFPFLSHHTVLPHGTTGVLVL